MIGIVAAILLTIAAPANADAWTDVLKQAGLSKEQVRFDPLDLNQVGGADFQGPFFKAVHGEPLRIPFYARLYREVMLDYAKEPYNAVTSALLRTGTGMRRTLEGDPLAGVEAVSKSKDGLVAALAHIHRLGGKPLTSAQQADIRKKAKSLSAETAAALSYLIGAEAHALEWRKRALAGLDKAFLARAFAERIQAPKREDQEDRNGLNATQRRLVREVDTPVLMAGGLDLILAVQRQREKLSGVKESETFEWNTPLGLVVLRGDSAANTYPANKSYLLIIDAGGDDTYLSGGGTYDVTRPVGVVIDLKGNDKYLAAAGLDDVLTKEERKAAHVQPAFGSGVFGYGILVDVEGDDIYRSYRQAQGRGDYGVGLLWDLGGQDTYECWTQCQASADFGAGVLIDMGGEDKYSATFSAQGFGGPAAAGVLIDAGDGADTYNGNDTVIDFPSLIDRKHNVSFVQGAAFGVRADGTDGHGLAGGFGALVDGGGNNSFKGGFFAQGIAYWYGVGWLSTGTGNDSYEAGKYALGAATHFGVGILHDSGGDDTYRVEQELGMGHGHDYAVGFFLEDGGKDTYSAPNLSLGCASAQGLGFFWDRSGDDKYMTEAREALGCASIRIDYPSFRVTSRTLGVFLDTGGKNEFVTPVKAIAGTRSSIGWNNKSAGVPEKVPARMAARLLGVGRVVNAPETEDPY